MWFSGGGGSDGGARFWVTAEEMERREREERREIESVEVRERCEVTLIVKERNLNFDLGDLRRLHGRWTWFCSIRIAGRIAGLWVEAQEIMIRAQMG